MNAKEERTTAGKHMILSLLAEEKKAALVLRKAAEGSKEREVAWIRLAKVRGKIEGIRYMCAVIREVA